jgi:hypothetical protein
MNDDLNRSSKLSGEFTGEAFTAWRYREESDSESEGGTWFVLSQPDKEHVSEVHRYHGNLPHT